MVVEEFYPYLSGKFLTFMPVPYIFLILLLWLILFWKPDRSYKRPLGNDDANNLFVIVTIPSLACKYLQDRAVGRSENSGVG